MPARQLNQLTSSIFTDFALRESTKVGDFLISQNP